VNGPRCWLAPTMSDAEKEEATDALGRRVWDHDEYQKKAEARVAEAMEKEKEASRPKKAVRRDDLQQRDFDVVVDANLGKSRMINGAHDKNGGYYCKVCDCILRDSRNYYDHLNGKKHARNQGMSMRVEQSSLSQVKARLALKKRKLQMAKAGPAKYDLDERVAALQEEDKKRKVDKQAMKRQRKKEKKAAARKTDDDIDDTSGVDPNMAALMGFAGFGGSKK